MKKLISFDVDMTLLDHADYNIPKSALKAVELLKKAGNIVAIATGRDMANHHGKPLADIIDPDAMIELNGTKITVGEKIIYRHYFDKSLLRRLAQFCLKKGYAIGVTIGDDDYYFNQNIIDEYDRKYWGASFRNFKNPEKLFDMDIGTLAYVGEISGAYDIEKNFNELRCPAFAAVHGADIIEKGNSKAEGLKRLCSYYGIDIADTVAFGDSYNDLEIVSEAGTGVAMGNAIEELKNAADFVTDDVGRDGVYNACVKLGLI